MKPFPTVAAAVRAHARWQKALEAAGSAGLVPRVDGRDSSGRRADLLSVYLSVGLCLKVVSAEELETVRGVLERPNRRLPGAEAAVYHRAMTRLGKEMRRRGVVGKIEEP